MIRLRTDYNKEEAHVWYRELGPRNFRDLGYINNTVEGEWHVKLCNENNDSMAQDPYEYEGTLVCETQDSVDTEDLPPIKSCSAESVSVPDAPSRCIDTSAEDIPLIEVEWT